MCNYNFFDPSSGMSVPGFGGGVRKTEGAKTGKIEFNFDFGFNKADKVGDLNNPLGIRRTIPTMEERIAEAILPKDGLFTTLAERAEYDRQVDDFFSKYTASLTPEDKARMSFNAQMAMYPMDNFVA